MQPQKESSKLTNSEILRKLPKVDLHCHLDGSVRVETIRDLAKSSGNSLPTEDLDDLKKYIQVPPDCKSLSEFLKCFDFYYEFLKSPEAMERIAYELCEDVSKENVRYMEVRFAPALQATDKFSIEDVVKNVLTGLEEGGKKFSVRSGAILCVYRSLSNGQNSKTVEIAEKFFGKGVVGIDLAGDEVKYPVEQYREAFQFARARKIPITCHAGEAAGPESVRNALRLGATRIGHGVRVTEDPKLYQEVIDRQVPFEVCVTSNLQTQVVQELHQHPLTQFYKDGLYVTLNTDDRGVSGIDLTHEYGIVHQQLGFSLEDCVKIIRNGINALFLDESEKSKLRRQIEKDMEKLDLGVN